MKSLEARLSRQVYRLCEIVKIYSIIPACSLILSEENQWKKQKGNMSMFVFKKSGGQSSKSGIFHCSACVNRIHGRSVADLDPNPDLDPPIHMFLGLPYPDPLVRGMDPDPSIIMQK